MKTETDKTLQTPDEVLNELRSLVAEAEKILGQGPSEGSEHRDDARRTARTAGGAQERVAQAYARAKRKVVDGAKYADETIRENPYQSIAVAMGVGLLAGVLLGRRWNSSR
jgi:ElaB/YqjD/DUF883 family membrane-anchored ribosome-binding protein